MAVRRKPLSARVISILRAKAKTRKNITLGTLKKYIGEVKVRIYHQVQDRKYLWLVGVWHVLIPTSEEAENTTQI